MRRAYQENTGITMYFTTPNKSKSNQTPREEEETRSAEGAQKSYCSEEREEKGKREEKKRSKEIKRHSITCIAPQEVCMPFFTRRLCEFEIT